MSKPRKKYRPKPVMRNPLALLMPTSYETKQREVLYFLTALEAMSRGQHPGIEDWRALSDAVNVVETLCLSMHKLVPSEVMPTINRAIAGMVECSKRFKAGKGMRLDAEGLAALREVVSFYEQCLDGLTDFEMEQAKAQTQVRVLALQRAKDNRPEVIEL